MASKYIIGIDLGTTNSAAGWLDTSRDDAQPQILPIPQVTAAGEHDERDTLASFVYLPDEHEVAAGSLDLPWASGRDYCVGAYARECAASLPGKTVASAKSWLCMPSVDRLAPILPWNRQNAARQLSPVAAARLIIEHIQAVWDTRMAAEPGAALSEQEIILTVPASFDAVARELTVQAATEAGLRVVLIEEPQAAFYSWLQESGDEWRTAIAPGERVLVCDLGGGTTDFSLIEVTDEDGDLGLRRVAVGDHILLGGDNMDLTLAYAVAARLREEKGIRLDAYQLAGLTHACREAKEKLCADPEAPPQRLTVLGRGSSLIGGTISTELSFAELERVLVDGFFPVCGLEERPQERRGGGLRSFGLSYAADPAVTRHLAAFVARHCRDEDGMIRPPRAVLFNGGVTKATVLRRRIIETLRNWAQAEVLELAGAKPDLAVALGACWYGRVRRGNTIRIKAGSAHSYYVGIESTMPAVPGFAPPLEALCVVPFGMEEGTAADIPYAGLGLVVGETTEFRFFASATRKDDAHGAILPDCADAELHEMPPLSATLPVNDDALPPGTLVPVRLRAVLNEIGTMQLWCDEEQGARQWKLEYELRAVVGDGPETPAPATVNDPVT